MLIVILLICGVELNSWPRHHSNPYVLLPKRQILSLLWVSKLKSTVIDPNLSQIQMKRKTKKEEKLQWIVTLPVLPRAELPAK